MCVCVSGLNKRSEIISMGKVTLCDDQRHLQDQKGLGNVSAYSRACTENGMMGSLMATISYPSKASSVPWWPLTQPSPKLISQLNFLLNIWIIAFEGVRFSLRSQSSYFRRCAFWGHLEMDLLLVRVAAIRIYMERVLFAAIFPCCGCQSHMCHIQSSVVAASAPFHVHSRRPIWGLRYGFAQKF